MFFIHFVTALIIALLLTALFMVGLRLKSPWGLLWFFVVILLASWAGGAWFTLRGPAFLGTGWLPFLIVGLTAVILTIARIMPAIGLVYILARQHNTVFETFIGRDRNHDR